MAAKIIQDLFCTNSFLNENNSSVNKMEAIDVARNITICTTKNTMHINVKSFSSGWMGAA